MLFSLLVQTKNGRQPTFLLILLFDIYIWPRGPKWFFNFFFFFLRLFIRHLHQKDITQGDDIWVNKREVCYEMTSSCAVLIFRVSFTEKRVEKFVYSSGLAVVQIKIKKVVLLLCVCISIWLKTDHSDALEFSLEFSTLRSQIL